MWIYVGLVSICFFLQCVWSEINSNRGLGTSIEESNDIFSNFLFPVEHIPDEPSRGQGRTAEWYQQFKVFTSVPNDWSITLNDSVSISSSLVGNDYTVSAILPGTRQDNIYILRRRQDPISGTSEISPSGQYDRVTEGAITVNCILQINISTGNVISAFGNDTFYYPNAMVRDPQGDFWFSDAAQHQVLLLNPTSVTPDITIGKQFAPGIGTSRLCAPTDVAVTSTHVYVADGHCNDRVILFNKTGGYIAEFGKAPGPNVLSSLSRDTYQLPLRYIKKPQALSVDQLRNRLYIADSAENGHSRVVAVMAGEGEEKSFGTGIRYFQHPEMEPYVGRIALHPQMPYLFALNVYNTHHLHRGFTFNTHDTSFKGAWGPDPRGFVRPRSIAVSSDGSTIYVSDATEEMPEKIWIFRIAEYLRPRRNSRMSSVPRLKGDRSPNTNKDSDTQSNYYNIANTFQTSSKGNTQQQVDDSNRFYQNVYLRYLSNQGTKGTS